MAVPNILNNDDRLKLILFAERFADDKRDLELMEIDRLKLILFAERFAWLTPIKYPVNTSALS